MKKAQKRLIQLAQKSVDGKKIKQVGLIHVNNLEGVNGLYDELCETFQCSGNPIIAEFTPGLSVHTGAGVIGFVLQTE